MIAAALLAGGLTAQTTNNDRRWVPVSRNGRTYVDMQSIRYRPSDPNYATFWLKTNDKDGTVMLAQWEMHRNRLHRSLVAYFYNAAGEMTNYSDKAGEWTELVPESVMEVMYDYLFPPSAKPAPTVRN